MSPDFFDWTPKEHVREAASWLHQAQAAAIASSRTDRLLVDEYTRVANTHLHMAAVKLALLNA